HCLTHSSQDISFRLRDHLGYWTFKSTAVYKPSTLRGFLCLGSAIVLHECDHELWKKLLGILPEHQESCKSWPRNCSISYDDVQAGQNFLTRSVQKAGTRARLAQSCQVLV